MPKTVLLCFFAILCHFFCHAQELPDIQTDRPDQTETPYTVPKNHFQMENGFSFEKTSSDSRTFIYPSSLIKFGLNERSELRLITQLSTVRSDKYSLKGLGPIAVGFKVNLTEEKGIIPITSFIGHISFPKIASKDFQATYLAPEFRFTMQHTLTKTMTLGYNLGAEWDGESPEPTYIYTLTTGFSLSPKWGAYAEVYGFAPQREPADHRIDGGFNYLLRKNILLDISGGFGLTENAPPYYIALGFSFRLKN
jgi:hypothetical protein